MAEFTLNTGLYQAEMQSDGTWLYKSNPNVPLIKGGSYMDKPMYPVIYQYEGEFKKNYDSMLKKMNRNILDKIMSYGK